MPQAHKSDNEPKTYNQIAGQNVQRLEAISDGVFAVAMTLLVLDVRLPVSSAIRSETELVTAFCGVMPRLLTYFLSFMTLGIFWTGHNLQYQFIRKSDRDLNWISLFFLMLVCLVPFTTAFLSEHVGFRFALGVYWLNILLLGIMVYVQWGYAYRHGFLVAPDQQLETINKAVRRRIIIAQSLYAAGALLCFINSYLSIGFIILVQLNYALGLTSRQKNRNNSGDK